MAMICFITSDKKEIRVRKEVACKMPTIASMFEALGCDAENEEPIPLNNITSDTLIKIIEWIKYQLEVEAKKEDPSDETIAEKPRCSVPIPKKNDKRKLTIWEQEYFNDVHYNVLFAIINAANFLDMGELVSCSAQVIAEYMDKKSLKRRHIRKIFGISNDLTDAQKKKLQKVFDNIDFYAKDEDL